MLKGETEPIIMTGTIGKEKKRQREFKEEEECVFLLLNVHGGEKA